MKRKIAILLCLALLVLMFAGCGTENTIETNSTTGGSAVTGKITAIEGNQVTLLKGTLSQGEKREMPTNENGEPDMENFTDENGEKMTMPEGFSGREMPTDENGEPNFSKPDMENFTNENGEKMTMPEGGFPGKGEKPTNENGEEISMPDMENFTNENGEKMTMPEGGFPGGMGGGGQTFTPGEESITVDFTGVTVLQGGEEKTVADLQVDDIVTVNYNSEGVAKRAEILVLFDGEKPDMPAEKTEKAEAAQ